MVRNYDDLVKCSGRFSSKIHDCEYLIRFSVPRMISSSTEPLSSNQSLVDYQADMSATITPLGIY